MVWFWCWCSQKFVVFRYIQYKKRKSCWSVSKLLLFLFSFVFHFLVIRLSSFLSPLLPSSLYLRQPSLYPCFFHDSLYFSFPLSFVVASFSFIFILFPFPLHSFPSSSDSFLYSFFLLFPFSFISPYSVPPFFFLFFLIPFSLLTSLFLSVLLCLLFLPLL